MTDNAAFKPPSTRFCTASSEKKAICGVTKILSCSINSNNVLSSMSLLVSHFVKYAASFS